MKLRVLSFGVSASHSLITPLPRFDDPVSVCDYDGFVFDPLSLVNMGLPRPDFDRRQNEVRDLIIRKGGVVICILRADRQIVVANLGGISGYSLFDSAAPQALAVVRTFVRAGEASQWRLVPDAKAALSGYFGVLRGNLRFEAFLEMPESSIGAAGGTVFAVNSVGYPVAVEFVAGAGRLCFVPVPHDVAKERVGAAIARVVEAHFGGPAEIEVPAWANEIAVPGADAHDGRIVELEDRREQIEAEISELEGKRSELLNYRRLLFGYGRTMLEPVVRQALRQLGFAVQEPEEYEGEWDVQLNEPRSGKTAIGEVEGSESAIDVDKYRQLLDYFQTEVLEGRVHKGILIGNGYRSRELDSPERQSQFTEHALRGARQNGFCLLPTVELFKAVCSVLEAPENEGLKIEIRNSILVTVGVWTFSRAVSALASAVDSSTPPEKGEAVAGKGG